MGKALQAELAPRDAVTFCGRDELDLSAPEALAKKLEAMRPAAIINASAYTAVDKAEEEREKAHAINAASVGVLAEFCAKRGIALVHYSTDYVFDGSGDAPWREDDAPAPLNYYGQSKLEGEELIAQSGCDHLIFRTSWVYDAQGKNFLTTMMRLGASMEKLNVVADQIGAPTYAPHLAELSVNAFEKSLTMKVFPSGVYHLCGGGAPVSWHGFAEAIFAQARARGYHLKVGEVAPIPSEAYPTPAKRPLNSRLNQQKLKDVFGLVAPGWGEGLASAMQERAKA